VEFHAKLTIWIGFPPLWKEVISRAYAQFAHFFESENLATDITSFNYYNDFLFLGEFF